MNPQALSLLLCGPFLDEILCGSFPTSWAAPGKSMPQALSYLALSCALAILVNYSQVRKLLRPASDHSNVSYEQFKCISAMSPTGVHLKASAVSMVCMNECAVCLCRFSGAGPHEDCVGAFHGLGVFWRSVQYENVVGRWICHGRYVWLRKIYCIARSAVKN